MSYLVTHRFTRELKKANTKEYVASCYKPVKYVTMLERRCPVRISIITMVLWIGKESLLPSIISSPKPKCNSSSSELVSVKLADNVLSCTSLCEE